MDWLWYVLCGLATWRITSLLVNEEGPFDILVKFRHFIGVRYDEHSQPYGKNVLGEIFTCVWCASVWVAFLTTFLLQPVSIFDYFAKALSLSAFAIMVECFVRR